MKHWYRDTVFSHIAQPYSDINKAFSSTQLPLTVYFLFFGPFSVNARDGWFFLVIRRGEKNGKIPVDE